MEGVEELSIQAKSFKVSVEGRGSLFRLSIIEFTRGKRFRILLGIEGVQWLLTNARILRNQQTVHSPRGRKISTS